VQGDLEQRANVQRSEMSEGVNFDTLLAGKAAYILFTLLMQNWQGVQNWNGGICWLTRAASNGYVQARADLPRVAAATNFELSEDLKINVADWLNNSMSFYQDRFILDTIEDMDPASYHHLGDRTREGWAAGPFPTQLFGDGWEPALYRATTEYGSFAHLTEDSHMTPADDLKRIYSAIRGNIPIFLEFLLTPDTGSRERRLSTDYGTGLTWVHFCAVIGLVELFQHPDFDTRRIDIRDDLGRTPLFFAAACGNSHIVLHLLEIGADISCGCDDKGNTVLHFVNIFNRDDIAKVVELLVERGADVNALNHKQETPVHKVMQGQLSARSNHVALIALLGRGADPSLLDLDGEVAHFWAIMTLQVESLELLLLEVKTKLSSQDLQLLKTDLLDRFMFAPQSEKLALAGPTYPACIDSTLQLVADEQIFEVFKELPDNGGDSVIFSASLRGAADIMISLCKIWPVVKVNECEREYGRPPLCYAIRHGRENIFDLLINLGADISYQDNMQENALHAAAGYTPHMLERVISASRSANRLDEMVKAISCNGNTPFDTAVINGHLDAARLLYRSEEDLNGVRCIGYGGFHTTLLGYILQTPTASVSEVSFLIGLGAQGIVAHDESNVFHALATRNNQLQDEGLQPPRSMNRVSE
jgi:ankyrin repeat protein